MVLYSFISIFTPSSSWTLHSIIHRNPSIRRNFNTVMMSAMATTANDKNYSDGSLLVSNCHKIGLLSTDKTSKLRLLLASQSPRRREILVSVETSCVDVFKDAKSQISRQIRPENYCDGINYSSLLIYVVQSDLGYDGARGSLYSKTIPAQRRGVAN